MIQKTIYIPYKEKGNQNLGDLLLSIIYDKLSRKEDLSNLICAQFLEVQPESMACDFLHNPTHRNHFLNTKPIGSARYLRTGCAIDGMSTEIITSINKYSKIGDSSLRPSQYHKKYWKINISLTECYQEKESEESALKIFLENTQNVNTGACEEFTFIASEYSMNSNYMYYTLL